MAEKYTDETLQYYDINSEYFSDTTADADMSVIYERFCKYLKPGGHILDAGCGSGRDSQYFIEQGYRVTALDGSAQLCRIAQKLIGQSVVNKRFDEIDFCGEFDAVWACASLLHVKRNEIGSIMQRLAHALVDGGILYASFKYGTGERQVGQRFFCDYNEHNIDKLFGWNSGLQCVEWWISEDVRDNRQNERWMNVIARKIYGEN